MTAPDPESGTESEAKTITATAPRWRRWTAGALIVLSCLLVPLSVLAIWVRSQVLNTDRYVENVTPLASNPEIIQTASTRITNALFDNVDVQKIAEDSLPRRARFLAAPLAAGVKQVVEDATLRILSSDQFKTAWEQANRVAHEQVRKALTNDGKVIKTDDGKIQLDLSSLVVQVRDSLHGRGISIFDRIPVDKLNMRIDLMDAEQLAKAQTATNLLNHLSWLLPLLSVVLLGLGLWLSSNRRRTLLRWGIGAAVTVAAVGAAVTVGRSFYLDAVTSPKLPRETAAAVFDTLVRFLRDSVRLMVAVGLLVALGAWVTGPGSTATRIRATVRSVVGSAGESAGSHGLNFGGFGVWVSTHRAPLRIAAILATLVVLLLWDHPRWVTLVGLTVLLLLLLGVIEFIARAATTPKPTVPGPTT